MDGAAESLDWVLSSGEGEDEHEDSEFTSSLANDDTIFIGDMAFLKQDLSSDIQTDGSVQYSMVRDKRKLVFLLADLWGPIGDLTFGDST